MWYGARQPSRRSCPLPALRWPRVRARVSSRARASCPRVPPARAVPSRACSRRVACCHRLRGAAVSARASCPRVPHARAVPSRACSVLRKKLVVLMKSAAVLPAGDPKLGLFHARRPSRAACALRAPRVSPSCPAFSSAVSCCRIPSVPGPSVRPSVVLASSCAVSTVSSLSAPSSLVPLTCSPS